jgi:glyoxylase-like metal-dependent hydrolase (beta-lactamase superfamily II)
MPRLIIAFLLLQSLALADFQQPMPGVHLWQDTCNVHVLKHEDAALVINLGDGTMLEHLAEIGVKRVEWVLLTDHHRELCQGAPKLDRGITKVAASADEKEILENPLSFRKWHPRLGDKPGAGGDWRVLDVWGSNHASRLPALRYEGCLSITTVSKTSWGGGPKEKDASRFPMI